MDAGGLRRGACKAGGPLRRGRRRQPLNPLPQFGTASCFSGSVFCVCVCVCVCLYMCVCVCTHTHTHTHANVGGGSSGLTVTRVCASGGVFVSRWEGAWERGDSTIRSLSMEAFPSFCTCARRARAQAPSACHPAPSSGKRGSGVRRCRDHGLSGAW